MSDLKPYESANIIRTERSENLIEMVLVDTWRNQQFNTDKFLESILKVENVTDRDKMIAETIIQWIGSNVGRAFIKSVFNESERIKKGMDDKC